MLKIPNPLAVPEIPETPMIQFPSYYPQIKVVVQDKGLVFEKILNDRLKEGWRIKELHFPSVATSTEGKVFFIAILEKLVPERLVTENENKDN